jgi:hypothetical protein
MRWFAAGLIIFGLSSGAQAAPIVSPCLQTSLSGECDPVNSGNPMPVTGSLSIGGSAGDNADGVAAVSTGLGQQQVYPYLWNGTTFDRWYGDKTNGAFVNVKSSVALAVTGTFWPYTLGQQLAAASVPVVLTAAQLATLTPPTTVTANQGTANTTPWNVNVTNAQVLGQNTAANSASVVLSSDNNTVTAVGNVAAGSADSGNPVKVGAVYNTTKPTLTNGLRGDLQLGARGSLSVQLMSPDASGAITFLSTGADASANGFTAYVNGSYGYGFNGTTWDRWRNNVDTAALITLAAAGAGTTNSTDQTNYNGRGVQVLANISAFSGTIAVTVNIQGKDAASGTYYNILSSTSLVGTGATNLTVYPGAGVTANVSASMPLPRTWRVQVVSGAGITPSVTMTVGASVID